MAKDPYKYFRIEAAELLDGLDEGMRRLETSPDAETVRSLLRHAHTLKGASRVVKLVELGDLAHELEDWLAPHRDAPASSALELHEGKRLLAKIRAGIADIDAPSRAPTAKSDDEAPRDVGATLRVTVADLDGLLDSVTSACGMAMSLSREHVRISSLLRQARELVRALERSAKGGALVDDAEALAEGLLQAERTSLERTDRLVGELGEVRRRTTDLRLVPVASLLHDLERAAQDAAAASNKEVDFVGSGGETDVDAHVLAGLRTALMHLVRNAVAHGVETPDQRRSVGKASRGRVEVAFQRRGHRVHVSCRDDGCGIDLGALRRAASVRGLGGKGEAEERTVSDLLLGGGLTTTETVTGISGRGVGWDAVRTAVEALDGEVDIETTEGVGTRVVMLTPFSLASIPTLTVHVHETRVLLPLDAIVTTTRVPRGDVSFDGASTSLALDDVAMPYLPLWAALGLPASRSDMQTVVVGQALGARIALGVDRIGATRSAVVQAIPKHARVNPIVTGASLDEEGDPILVLSIVGLARAATSFSSVQAAPDAPVLPPVLVIDDSLTTRMLEQGILESAGYDVDLAVSGEDALAKARSRRYGLFIVDVEMPGMGGFEFVARTRTDPDLRSIPSILVTSLSSEEDKRRGKHAGARAYIVKSEFDQAELLDHVRRLIG